MSTSGGVGGRGPQGPLLPDFCLGLFLFALYFCPLYNRRKDSMGGFEETQ
jgi:hypothetical protein